MDQLPPLCSIIGSYGDDIPREKLPPLDEIMSNTPEELLVPQLVAKCIELKEEVDALRRYINLRSDDHK